MRLNYYKFISEEYNKKRKYLYKLSSEYHRRTENYDRTVCTGPIKHGLILPANGLELVKINKFALKVLRELQERAYYDYGIECNIVKKYIQNYKFK